MMCPKCGHDNRTGAKFCEQCGTALAPVCTQCGARISPTAKFCSECGRPSSPETASASSPSRFGAPEDYTPAHLAERILTSRVALEGERKLVTALFADVRGSMIDAVGNLAAEKNISLKVDMPNDLPVGRGDEQRIRQVLLNLVGNAIKFTEVGEVAISAVATDGAFAVSVSDTGPGISAADQAKLLQEFQQADASSTRKIGGTGLGLAISKRFVEMHGGHIWVESTPGLGSTFRFTIPITAEAREEAA